MDHENIVRLVDSGTNGSTSCGKTNLVYMILEYVPNAILLFDLVKRNGVLGEDAARYFLRQFVAALEYMHETKGIVHRDLKMENILITPDLQVKIVDFGFATYYSPRGHISQKGTKTYMAPEIKLGKLYDGKQVDVFSVGVIVFILAHGIYPFNEATISDQYYNMILNGNLDQYWKAIQGQNLSPEFKDFVLRFFTFSGSNRITLEGIKEHVWYTQEIESDYRIQRKIVKKFEQNGGPKGVFRIIKQNQQNDTKKIESIKFQKEEKQEGDSNSHDSERSKSWEVLVPTEDSAKIPKKTVSRIIEISVQDVDIEIQDDEQNQSNEKYRYDKRSKTCVRRTTSQQDHKSNWRRAISKVYEYFTARRS